MNEWLNHKIHPITGFPFTRKDRMECLGSLRATNEDRVAEYVYDIRKARGEI